METTTGENLRGGALLKFIREDKGISIETVHDVTKIPMDALRAIEEGYTVRTLTPFYIKGFLKIYAQYLNVDISEVIDDYQSEKLPPVVKQKVNDPDIVETINKRIDKKTKQKIVIVCGYILCLFVIFKIITFFTGSDESTSKAAVTEKTQGAPADNLIALEEQRKKEELAKKAAEAQAAEKAKLAKQQEEAQKAEVQKKKKEEARRRAAEITRQTAVTPAVRPRSNETVTRIPIESTMDNVTLTVRAKKNSWLRVASDGNVVFQSTLRLGSVETWMANEKIEISGKNINSLEFELNGKMIGSLGREDRKAKKLIVTKDGLTVTQ